MTELPQRFQGMLVIFLCFLRSFESPVLEENLTRQERLYTSLEVDQISTSPLYDLDMKAYLF